MTLFSYHELEISGLFTMERIPKADERGIFERLYCDADLEPILGGRKVKQINRSVSRRIGMVRGLHFQHPPYAETKVVTCTRGEVYDVAVDLRPDSPTFLQWHGELLSESNYRSFVIPEGFAHGFQTLAAECQLIYFHTASFSPEREGGINALDPRLSISWPLEVTDRSNRDEQLPYISPDYSGVPK